MLFFASNLFAAGACPVDTTQADFQLGIPTNVNLLGSGDVVLATSATLDQANTNLSANGFQFHSYWWFGQTFTAGVSGPLTAADIRMFCSGCSGTMPDITVAIRATAINPAGEPVPTGADLATATIPGFTSGGGAYYKATFGNPMNMVAGTKYAVIVRANSLPTSGSYAYLVSAEDPYSGGHRVNSTNSGSSWTDRPYDIGFRIYSGAGHVAAGDLVSSLKDSNPPSGSNPTWPSLSWGATTPGSTNLRFQAAASNSASGPFNFVGPDGTSGSYFTSSGAALSQFNGMRYLKYKALLSSSNPSATPTLKDATVCYDNVGTAPSADLQITKTDGATVETPGTSVTYTIVASNAGPSNVTGATVTDSFPAALQSCTWTCSGASGGSCATASGSGNINHGVNLPAESSATFTASCTVSASATGSLANTASISSTVADPVSGNNTATDTDSLTASANLGITKTNGVSSSTPGGQTTYTIVASNAGPSNVTSATVADTFSSNHQNCSWTCSGSGGGSCAASGNGNISQSVNLPAGASTTFVASCGIKPSATGSLVNTATISSATADPVSGNNTAIDTDSLTASANLGITKTNGVSSSTPGGQTTYTIVASNAGPSNVTSATVADTFSSNHQNCSWTCSGSGGGSCAASGNGNISQSVNLPAGASTTFVASCGIKPSATGSLVNTASISSATADTVSGNNTATDTDTLTASANLGITKTNGVSSSTPGGQTTYTIVASNAGPSNVTSATVADTFSSNHQNCSWTCSGSGGGSCAASGNGNISQSVNLPAGASTTFVASCGIKPSATGSLVNTATISSATADPVSGNNTATDTDTLGANADLRITLDNEDNTIIAGTSVIYTIVASNFGPSAVSNATVTDVFSNKLENCEWVCGASAGSSCAAAGVGNINQSVNLPVQGAATFTAICDVKAAATGSLVNTASISSSTSDPVAANNSATDTASLSYLADLSVTLQNTSSSATAGSTVNYTIIASNAGSSTANQVTVQNTFPSGLTSCSWTCQASAGAVCPAAGSGHINHVVTLPRGSSVSYSASCTVAPQASGTLVNMAEVFSGIDDPDLNNNQAIDTIQLDAKEEIIFKSGFD